MNAIDHESPDSAVNTVQLKATSVLIILGLSLIPTIYSLALSLYLRTAASDDC